MLLFAFLRFARYRPLVLNVDISGWIVNLRYCGRTFVTIGFGCFLIRVRNEERMLVEAFGDEYREYQRATKRLIPYVY